MHGENGAKYNVPLNTGFLAKGSEIGHNLDNVVFNCGTDRALDKKEHENVLLDACKVANLLSQQTNQNRTR